MIVVLTLLSSQQKTTECFYIGDQTNQGKHQQDLKQRLWLKIKLLVYGYFLETMSERNVYLADLE